jgi:outer membrane protein assembly factor BamB
MRPMNCLRVAVVLACLTTGSLSATLRREPPPRQEPVLSVSGPALIWGAAGVGSSHAFDVRYSGAGGYLAVSHDVRGLETQPVITPLGGGGFRVTLRTNDRVPEGLNRGTMTVRMCTETPCRNEIPGAVIRKELRVHLAWVDGPDWASYQGNAAHDGHVGIAIDPRRIASAWTWELENSSWFPFADQVATSGNLGFIPMQPPGGRHALVAFDLRDGSIVWNQDLSQANALNAAATSGDRVYVTTTGHADTFLWSFDAHDGTLRSQSAFRVQWSRVLAPTIADGVAYVNGGLFDKGVYAFDADDGLPLWSAFSDNNDETTPAAADGRVYYYDGYRLKVYDAFDGTDQFTIEDPLNPVWHGYSYAAAPMLGSADHVIAPSGNNRYSDRRLVDYAPSKRASRWVSARAYRTPPAVSDGVVYAASNNPKSFDAIDEANGRLIASWVPGVSERSFVGNIVLTRNLAFVSTDVATYAIDRATHRPVWSTPVAGTLSISGTGVLLIVEHFGGGSTSSRRLHAYSLR